MATMNKGTKISERLRTAIQNTGESLNHMAQATGVAASVLSRFVRCEQGITMDTADTLAEYLGLDLLPAKASARTRKGR